MKRGKEGGNVGGDTKREGEKNSERMGRMKEEGGSEKKWHRKGGRVQKRKR
jgi:hypothetical protein